MQINEQYICEKILKQIFFVILFTCSFDVILVLTNSTVSKAQTGATGNMNRLILLLALFLTGHQFELQEHLSMYAELASIQIPLQNLMTIRTHGLQYALDWFKRGPNSFK